MLGSPRAFSRHLITWYDVSRRDLPWRVLPGEASRHLFPDPYHVLVSELMLQQTQVATVIPFFKRFLERFPTIQDLAQADEQDVLRLWQGLGYYSRARNLQKAARKVVADFDGQLPRTVQELLTLPGVGKYTAGAIASLAFGTAAPILDGNVARVLCRVDKIETDLRERLTQEVLWTRAEQILPAARVGDFNSALMELGATVCIPKNPQCLICPVRAHCEALKAGLETKIPPPRVAKESPVLQRWVFCIATVETPPRWLIELRPAIGRWAGMWQFPAFEPTGKKPTPASVKKLLTIDVSKLAPAGQIQHALTHRRYEFSVFQTTTPSAADLSSNDRPRKWVTLEELNDFPLPRPHVLIAQQLRDQFRPGGTSACSPG